VLPSAFYYFTGDCHDAAVQEQIKSNFVSIMNDQTGLEICPPNDCSVENVEVKCADTKKKRSIEQQINYIRLRRSTTRLKLSFKIKSKWQLINGSSSDEFNHNENRVMNIWNEVKLKGAKVAENVSGVTFDSSEYDWTDAECSEEGTKVVYSSNGVSCCKSCYIIIFTVVSRVTLLYFL